MQKSDTNSNQLKQALILIIVMMALMVLLGVLLSTDARSATDGKEASARGGAKAHGGLGAVRSPDMAGDSVRAARDERECDDELRRRAERRFLHKIEPDLVVRYTQDYELPENEKHIGHLVVSGGNLILSGKVEGTVLVVCGDVEVREAAVVEGDVVCIGGRINRASGSRVTGDQVEASPRSLYNGQKQSTRESWDREWRDWRRRNRYTASIKGEVHYQRVDGLYLGVELPRLYDDNWGVGIFGSGGYGFANEFWQYQVGGEFYAGGQGRIALGVEAHDFTDSEDDWIISEDENSLAGFFLNEDFRDYYRRSGFSAYINPNISEIVDLKVGYQLDDHIAQTKETDWALFGNSKHYRDNPPAEEGRAIGVFANFSVDTRNHRTHPDRGWWLQFEGEFNLPEWESDFAFDRVIVDLRRYQPVGFGKNLDFRLRAGSGRGILPAQYLFDLGGLSTLQGYRLKSFTGDRMLLGNLEYRIDAGRSRLRDIPLLGELNLVFFGDAGMTWDAEDKSGIGESFDYFRFDRLNTSAGIGLTDNDGHVRLNFAKRLDVGDADLVVTFRLNRNF
ncbi:MAG: BamA/TamA family outer membrane protein [bacterium]